jgi:hypothetical protein
MVVKKQVQDLSGENSYPYMAIKTKVPEIHLSGQRNIYPVNDPISKGS